MPTDIVHEILALDEERRTTQNKLDGIQAELNTISKEIGALIKANRKEEAEAKKNLTVQLKKDIESLSQTLENYETTLKNLLVKLPNLPSHTVPEGNGAEENIMDREGGRNA